MAQLYPPTAPTPPTDPSAVQVIHQLRFINSPLDQSNKLIPSSKIKSIKSNDDNQIENPSLSSPVWLLIFLFKCEMNGLIDDLISAGARLQPVTATGKNPLKREIPIDCTTEKEREN